MSDEPRRVVRVLHVIPSVSMVHGGPSHALAMMERSLSAIGLIVATATTDDDGPGRRLAKAAQPESSNGASRIYARKWTEFYKVAPGLLFWLIRHCRNYDVMHVHALFSFSTVAAAIAARMRGVPYIIRPLGTLNNYGILRRRPWLKALSFRLIERPILKRAAAVHFTSQAEWDEAKELGVTMRGVIVPLGVDGPEFSVHPPAAPPFTVQSGAKVILFLSRLDPKKNVEGLITAVAMLRSRHPSIALVVAGDGSPDYVAALKARAAAEGIADITVWTGHLEGRRKWAAFAAADVFVLPSYSENFGIAAAEALAFGLACVIAKGVAIAEGLADENAAAVTDPDPQAINCVVAQLLDDDLARREMALRGQRFAAREFGSEVMAKRLMGLYSTFQRPLPLVPEEGSPATEKTGNRIN